MDLKTATAPWVIPVSMKYANGGYTTYNPPPPSSGIVVNFILSILDGKFAKTSYTGVIGVIEQTIVI